MSDLLTPRQVAERLNVSLTSVYELLRGRKIGHKRIGRVYRVSECDMDDYLDRVSVTVADSPARTSNRTNLRKLVKDVFE